MRVLVTGSNGLIGSEAVAYFDGLGADVVGVDNNMRAVFFGKDGDTRWNQHRLESELRRFSHRELDIRDREGVLRLIADEAPDLIVHCAPPSRRTTSPTRGCRSTISTSMPAARSTCSRRPAATGPRRSSCS